MFEQDVVLLNVTVQTIKGKANIKLITQSSTTHFLDLFKVVIDPRQTRHSQMPNIEKKDVRKVHS